MLIVPALTIMSDDSAGGGVLLDSSDAASTSAYDPPEETLRIVVDNGGNTTNIDMREEDDDEEDEDNSDIKVYRALINDDSCEDSLDRLKLFQSLGSPAVSDLDGVISSSTVAQVHSDTYNCTEEEDEEEDGTKTFTSEEKKGVSSSEEERLPLNPCASPKHYPNEKVLEDDSGQGVARISSATSNQILREHCRARRNSVLSHVS